MIKFFTDMVILNYVTFRPACPHSPCLLPPQSHSPLKDIKCVEASVTFAIRQAGWNGSETNDLSSWVSNCSERGPCPIPLLWQSVRPTWDSKDCQLVLWAMSPYWVAGRLEKVTGNRWPAQSLLWLAYKGHLEKRKLVRRLERKVLGGSSILTFCKVQCPGRNWGKPSGIQEKHRKASQLTAHKVPFLEGTVFGRIRNPQDFKLPGTHSAMNAAWRSFQSGLQTEANIFQPACPFQLL